jgi:hypothetical protein
MTGEKRVWVKSEEWRVKSEVSKKDSYNMLYREEEKEGMLFK